MHMLLASEGGGLGTRPPFFGDLALGSKIILDIDVSIFSQNLRNSLVPSYKMVACMIAKSLAAVA